MPYDYKVISFAASLAGQEVGIKFAALLSLNHFFKCARLDLKDEPFWDHVEAYQDETDGLYTHSREPIFECPVRDYHVDKIERLGFQVSPL